MGYREGLAVGLAIGLPSGLILIACSLFWYRNQRKQNREDSNGPEMDIGLNDDNLFNQFQDELHKPMEEKDGSPSKKINEHTVEKPYQSSLSHGSSSSNFVDSRSLNLQPRRDGQRTASSYDFYDQFIPILPQHHSQSSHGNINKEFEAPPPISEDGNTEERKSSDVSISNSLQNKSLDNLAKQLNAPTFFEKLPSRAATMALKTKTPLSNNSSTDLFETDIVNNTALNDNFVYEAKLPEHVTKQIRGYSNTEDIHNTSANSDEIVEEVNKEEKNLRPPSILQDRY